MEKLPRHVIFYMCVCCIPLYVCVSVCVMYHGMFVCVCMHACVGMCTHVRRVQNECFGLSTIFSF